MEHLEPGWYPDPGGTTEEFRYWDGDAWSSSTTSDPRDPAPARRGSAPPPRPPRRTGPIIAVAAAVLAVAIAGTLVFRFVTADDAVPTPTVPSGTSVRNPFDQSVSPSPAPSEPASPRPSRSESSPGRTPVPTEDDAERCPRGNPNARSPHPDDGRLYGGNLSFAAVDGFGDPVGESRLSFAWDVVQQTRRVNADPQWIAQFAVGQLRGEDGFGSDARVTAEQVIGCLVTGDLYQLYSGTSRDGRSEAIELDGRAGWVIETDVRVKQPGLPFPGDRVSVVVVRDGDNWGMFFGAVPIGNEKLIATLTDVTDELRAG